MPVTVSMPQMGESVIEGTLERWTVREGEWIEKDQTLCEMTTDKVDAEIPAPASGVVTRILVPEGTTVEVGADLAIIDPDAKATVSPQRAPPGDARSPAEAAAAAMPSQPARPAPSSEAQSDVDVSNAGEASATPLARRIADDAGVPLEQMEGSGPAGRVVKADVVRYLADSRAAAEPTAAARPGTLGEFLNKMRVPRYRPRPEDTVIPFTTIRRRIAEHMVVSKVVSPHVGTLAEVDMHAIVQTRGCRRRGGPAR